MKMGWRKPIAEATAFQSDFAIAESGPKLLGGWVHQDNPMAVQTWKDICAYFGFKADNQALLTDVSTVSKTGVLAPPLVPSFEVALRRESLYKALAEMSVMYDVLLLHHVTPELLSRYKAIIVTDIPWLDSNQWSALEAFKQGGGKLYTIGSAKKIRDISDLVSPADLFGKLGERAARKELSESLRRLEGEPLVTVEGARYVAANLVRKQNQKRFILHLVNYDRPVQNVDVKVNLDGIADGIDPASLRLYSPDSVPKTVKVMKAGDKSVEFQVPELDVYSIITIN